MTTRLRPVQFVIHPAVMMDDGVSLKPVHIEPIVVAAEDIADFAASFAEDIAAEQLRLNTAGE